MKKHILTAAISAVILAVSAISLVSCNDKEEEENQQTQYSSAVQKIKVYIKCEFKDQHGRIWKVKGWMEFNDDDIINIVNGEYIQPVHWDLTVEDPDGNILKFQGVSYHQNNDLINLNGYIYDKDGTSYDIEITVPELKNWLGEMYNNYKNSKNR